MHITPTGQACGAVVRGIDLTAPLGTKQVAMLRAAWLQHRVLVFPQQPLRDDDLERFTLYFGGFGDDPFIAPIPGRQHIIAIQRNAHETSPIFAESWHTDWSFQAHPPAGTCLLGITIPPTGGDTLFADQHKALATMPAALRAKIEGKTAVHSAAAAYAPEGSLGNADTADRSIDIRPSVSARQQQTHPIIMAHAETGEPALFGTIGYIAGIEGMPPDRARALLRELHAWQGRTEFQYRHKWEKDMLVMWDNRTLLHRATGGYQGHARLLHRTTIAAYQAPG